MAYSFGHLKSAKSSEDGRTSQRKISVIKRMRILKTVELADFAEKNTKRMNILKEREFECGCSTERIEAIAVQRTFVMQGPREKNLQSVIVISNVVENFIIHETMLSATKRMGFYKNDLISTFSEKWYKKNGILFSTNSTVFRKCQKEYALNVPGRGTSLTDHTGWHQC